MDAVMMGERKLFRPIDALHCLLSPLEVYPNGRSSQGVVVVVLARFFISISIVESLPRRVRVASHGHE